MKSLLEMNVDVFTIKFINAGHVKEFIDELEDFPDKYEKELKYLFGIYNEFVNFVAYKFKK